MESTEGGRKVVWRRPAKSFEHYWRTEGMPAHLQFLGYWAKWSAILVPPAAAVGWYMRPEQAVLFCLLVLIMVGGPLALMRLPALVPAYRRRWPEVYRVDEKGLATEGLRIPWRYVEGAQIADHPDLPGLRRLSMKVRGRSLPATIDFDPQEVEEELLAETLTERVHAKVLLRPSAGGDEAALLRPAAAELASAPRDLLRASEEPCGSRVACQESGDD